MTEASVVDLMPVGSATTFNVEFSENPEIYEINVTEEPYGQEPAEIFVVGGLAEALSTSTRSPGILEGDKEYVAAVDTACNKTCAGEQWIRLMRDCLKRAPHYIQALVDEQPTTDFFKFGNGGVLTSQLRVRLPVCLMGHVVLVWISSVPCGSLGCLIGKDPLESLGAVLDIVGRKMMLKFLGPEWINLSKMRVIFTELGMWLVLLLEELSRFSVKVEWLGKPGSLQPYVHLKGPQSNATACPPEAARSSASIADHWVMTPGAIHHSSRLMLFSQKSRVCIVHG